MPYPYVAQTKNGYLALCSVWLSLTTTCDVAGCSLLIPHVTHPCSTLTYLCCVHTELEAKHCCLADVTCNFGTLAQLLPLCSS